MSARADDKLKAMLLSERASWQGVAYTKLYKYLGVLFGPKMDQEMQYKAAFEKVEARLRRYSRALSLLTPVRRIDVYNIFVHPLFSYVSEFFPVAYDGLNSYKEVLKLIRRQIIPFGTGFKYTHIIAPSNTISPAKPIIDLWSYCMVRMAEQGDLGKYVGATNVSLPKMKGRVSQRISDQIEANTKLFVKYAILDEGFNFPHKYDEDFPPGFDPAPFTGPDKKKARRNMYDVLVRTCIREYGQHEDLRAKLEKRGLPCDDQAVLKIAGCFDAMVATIPDVARYHQFLMYFNANATSERVRGVRGRDFVAPASVCWLCGQERDHATHLFGRCSVVARSMRVFSDAVQYKLDPVSLGVESCLQVAYLVFDAENRAAEIAAITVFNWAVFYTVRTYYENSPAGNESDAVHLIMGTALRVWRQTRKEKWKEPSCSSGTTAVTSLGSASKRTRAQREEARRRATAAINAAEESRSIVVFTDGSARPNPGPAGAGVYMLTASERAPLVEAFAALGHATNNVGELWAIGLALQIVLHGLAQVDDLKSSPIAIFTDSKWAAGVCNFESACNEHVDLVHAVRDNILSMKKSRRVSVNWIGGHIDLDGNDFADFFANKGAELSGKGSGMEDFMDFINDFGLFSGGFSVRWSILQC